MDIVSKVVVFTLIPFTLAFSFIVFVLYRKRREATYRQHTAELLLKIAEVETKALRAQINPHFIFNCLNSIYFFIQQKKPEEAAEYLLKFSNLIRLILENSLSSMVELENDLKAIELYIQMEQWRMNHRFSYSIHVDPAIDPSVTLIPPMISQPFIENSIWHGLNAKADGGISAGLRGYRKASDA